jgi:glycosyltransferase involved in cell wall biosynthesis
MTNLTAIILTRNEALHLPRALASLQGVATRIVVVDSGSEDATAQIAKAAGAQMLTHPWTNYAQQFNWALDQLDATTEWVLRLDADEWLTPQLAAEIRAGLPDVAGVYVGRSMWFQGAPVRHGGVFPIRVLRLFRHSWGRCEARWMDEHIVVQGPVAHLRGQIIDDNRKPLDWWIAKHNAYASREVADILTQSSDPARSIARLHKGRQAEIKRWIKERIYARLPLGVRAWGYFGYRYILRLGFLDAPQARAFHVLQGFWYRYLVDAKLAEVRATMRREGLSAPAAIRQVLGIDIGAS